jgi:hypothetical protein
MTAAGHITHLMTTSTQALALSSFGKCANLMFGLTRATEHSDMLWTIFVILLVLWLLGLVTSYTFGGFVHILLVLAVVVLVIRLLQGRRIV